MHSAIKHTVKISLLAASLAGTMLLTGCGPKQDANHIKVGISAGIDQPLWDTVTPGILVPAGQMRSG
ncbi:D-methionine transport system substrate-binding protein [Cedecea sp. NFIX57]|nr:D-methionine transport system substrate-binding protein [Cedecea sp. NFIX57]